MEQRTPEWFEVRKKRITGSIVGAILGMSPYMTRADAMRLMVREALGAEREFTGNPATEWGVANEPTARFEFELETGVTVSDASFVAHEDWLGASPDGHTDDGGLIEIKCPYYIRNDPEPVFKSIWDQEHYYAQIQIQLFVTGCDICHFWQWAPRGHNLEIVPIYQPWLDLHLPVLRQFHAEFLHELGHNADEHLAPKRVVIDTPQAHLMIEEYDNLCEQIENAEARKKELLAEMIETSGYKNSIFAGRNLTQIHTQGNVSYAKALKKYAPNANLEPFRGKPFSFWVVK